VSRGLGYDDTTYEKPATEAAPESWHHTEQDDRNVHFISQVSSLEREVCALEISGLKLVAS
jgi:hypothetical protein